MKRTVSMLTAALFVGAIAMPAFAQAPAESPAAAASMAAPSPESSPAAAASGGMTMTKTHHHRHHHHKKAATEMASPAAESSMKLRRQRPRRLNKRRFSTQCPYGPWALRRGMRQVTRPDGRCIFSRAPFCSPCFAGSWAPCAKALFIPVIFLLRSGQVATPDSDAGSP